MSLPPWPEKVVRFVHVLLVTASRGSFASWNRRASTLAAGIGACTAAGGSALGNITATSASYKLIGATSSPVELRGPGNAFLSAATCGCERHESVFAPLQVSTAGSNVQASGLNTIPSLSPSFASQTASMLSTNSFLSASE